MSKNFRSRILFIVPFLVIIALYYSLQTVNVDNKTRENFAQLVPQDPRYSEQKNTLDNIQLESAWEITTGSEREIIVAVIDDAIDINHPDLKDNLIAGYDFVDGNDDPSPELCTDPVTQIAELETHGTQVAGVIGARGSNNIGIAGVSWYVKIMPLRIGCFYSRTLETQAVQYAINNGAHIINASYGGPNALVRNEAVIELLKTTGQSVLLVAAAGNDQINNDDTPMYPANLNLPNVISVAASDGNNRLTEWAQFGASSVDITAPGVNLKTTTAGGGYGEASGSSFSTAVVSGVAALLKAYDVEDRLSASDLKAVLQASVTPVSEQKPYIKTMGVVNARAALDLINSPRPVMSIVGFHFEDAGQNFENSRLDNNETGTLVIELENLWEDVLTGNISISVNHIAIRLSMRDFNLLPMAADERRILRVPIQISTLNGHQRIRFTLDIQLTSESGSVSYQRHFELQTGILANNVAINALIQKNNQDDYQYYHFNIEPGLERVSIELDNVASDTRNIGLLADFDQRPQINFRGFNGAKYWYSAKYRVDNDSDFERIGFRIPAINPSTLNIMVFNRPASTTTTFDTNKAYKLKVCSYSELDGNVPPQVNAGEDKVVLPNERVMLRGEVNDSDGEITRFYWRSDSGIAFSKLNETDIVFDAPTTGEHSFSFIAIDNGCKQSVDRVMITIEDENGNEPEGLILNPRRLNIDENSGFDVRVSAFYNSREISNLRLVSAPEGVVFSGGNLSWTNASPVGVHVIQFSVTIDGETLSGAITVNIASRSVGNGGGCVALNQGAFDPLFFIYLFLSYFSIRNKTVLRNKN